MKLKSIFECEDFGNETVYVSMDSNVFNGMLRVNHSAATIIECLKHGTSVDSIALTLMNKYNIPKDDAMKAVDNVLCQLKDLGVLE